MIKDKNTKFISQSAQQTQQKAEELALSLIENISGAKKAQVVGLIGDLGSGKTTFAQGLAKGLNIKEKITSPTFAILKRYQFLADHKKSWLYHIDCYRLENAKDLIDLDFQEIIEQPNNIVLIEWAEKVKKILPQKNTVINFEYLDKDKREITFICERVREIK